MDEPAASPEELRSPGWWLKSAAQYADAVEGAEAKNDVYWQLSSAQARAGDLEAAATSASRVAAPYRCVMAYTFVADRYHKQGDDERCRAMLEKAREVATATKEARTNNFIYAHLIRAYVELGMVDEAKSLVQQLPPWWHRYLGSQDLAADLAKQGDLKQAMEIAQQQESDKLKQSAMAAVAFACAHAARVEDVQTVAGKLSDAKDRDRAFRTLAEALAKAGRLDEAQQAAGQITSPESKAEAEAAVLTQWAEGQQPAAIAARIGQVSTREEKLALYRKLVEKLAAAGSADEAEKAIGAMVDVIRQSPRPVVTSAFGQFGDSSAIATANALYLPLAKALAQRGDQAGARRCVAQAEKSILELPRQAGFAQAMLLSGLVTTQAEIGDVQAARRTLEKVNERFPRATAASQLGPALVKAGDVPAALQAVALVDLPGGKGTYVAPTAVALIRQGDLPAARQVLAGLSDSVRDAQAYRTVGQTMLETRRGEELLQWLPEMPSNSSRALACIGAAQAIEHPNRGHHD